MGSTLNNITHLNQNITTSTTVKKTEKIYHKEGELLRIKEGKKKDVYLFLWACKYNQLLQLLPKELRKIVCSFLYYTRDYAVGDLIDVIDTVYKWYPCIILKVDQKEKTVFIHYYGWTARYDEWIKLTSARLDTVWTHDEHYGPLGSLFQSNPCSDCEKIKPIMSNKIFGIQQQQFPNWNPT